MGTIVGQVLNQSLNVAVNYCNANESSRLSRPKLIQSYLLAVAASCSVAVGFSSTISRIRSLPPNARVLLGRFAPFAAVASAGFLNVFLVRGEELRKGIDIFTLKSHPRGPETLLMEQTGPRPEILGKSKKAAMLAVSETAFSRVLNCAPIMILPPLALFGLQKTRWLQQNPRMAFPINFGLITVTSFAALPLALAAFPQRQSTSAKALEPEFHGQGDEDGMVAFNRGI
jgi:sideroflexin-5